MTVYISASMMTSDITPECARREDGAARWRLSWLPDRALTRDQARAGMETDELLSDPTRVDDPMLHAAVEAGAAALGLPAEQVILVLSTRILARMAEEFEVTPRVRGGHAGGDRASRRAHLRVIEPPKVFG
ncbi:hypothetical protein [Nocardia bovistercoris]|uniref:Uncharacterized protein n=1 Tax=Nocardia bovistercoris TaxID=2785916 RepID=A0A931N5A2_9NOCA|nr:hypothetical protein [Nocardia bovistercoris]MBH0779527.1 hypothetical protein [Nocardia bovistercoris]